MKEIIIYSIVAASSLFLWGYVVHMLIGGLVDAETEKTVMMITVSIGVVVMGLMARDVIIRRRNNK